MTRIAFWLLLCCLSACEQTAQPTVSNAPQSAVEVRAQASTLALPSLSSGALPADDNSALQQAFADKQSHVWLQGHGTVVKVLPDDTRGARHQRFLVRISAQQTLLFAHNIDLAPRIATLQAGEPLQFKGEYIYNPKGGILHWTHHDPQGRHSGWIQYQGQTYE